MSPARSREVHVLFEELDATVDTAAAGRKLTVKTVFDGIAAELARLGPTYTRLRDPHGAFAPYATLPELVRPLAHGKTAEDHRVAHVRVSNVIRVAPEDLDAFLKARRSRGRR